MLDRATDDEELQSASDLVDNNNAINLSSRGMCVYDTKIKNCFWVQRVA